MNTIQEKLPRTLGALYRSFGYMPYTMSKFEEYGLYLQNKDFLISDRVLTFTDTDGKLMALKPDVTLSIIKNARHCDDPIQKLFYRENVYRPGKSGQGFREIMQIGLECMGAVDRYCVAEVLLLASKSLEAIGGHWVLDVSHMGLMSEALNRSGLEGAARRAALEAIGSRNPHELRSLCRECNGRADVLTWMTDMHDDNDASLKKLEEIFPDSAEVEELRELLQTVAQAGYGENIRLDFSVVNDMQYYNGLVFRGFVEGVPEGVLSGGQYDGLMQRMHRKEKAIGFALYPDLLERLETPGNPLKMEAVLLYPAGAPVADVYRGVLALTQQGLRVCAQPDTGRQYPDSRVYVLRGNEVIPIGSDA